MSVLGKDMRSWLLADSSITAVVGNRVHHNHVPQQVSGTRIWFARATTDDESAIDEATGTRPFYQYFDMEVVSLNLDQLDDVIELVQAKRWHRGSFGSGTVQSIEVEDHAEGYVPRSVNADDGYHVAAVQVKVTGYTPGA